MGCCGAALPKGSGLCARGAGLFGGVVDDFRRRLPYYGRDLVKVGQPPALRALSFMVLPANRQPSVPSFSWPCSPAACPHSSASA